MLGKETACEDGKKFSGSGGRCTSKMTFQEGKFFSGSLLLSLYTHFENIRNGETHIWDQLKQTSGVNMDFSIEKTDETNAPIQKSGCYCLKWCLGFFLKCYFSHFALISWRKLGMYPWRQEVKYYPYHHAHNYKTNFLKGTFEIWEKKLHRGKLQAIIR